MRCPPTSLEIHPYRGTAYRIFQGKDTRQLNGHTHEPALDDCWYWEPVDYAGDVLYSNAYETAADAMIAAEQAFDLGDWV